MSYIRVFSNDEDKMEQVVELLRGVGVEALTSETPDREELLLFYLSRMNNKLDNLGQLRHLTKIEKHLNTLANQAETANLLTVLAFQQSDGILSDVEYETLVKRVRARILQRDHTIQGSRN